MHNTSVLTRFFLIFTVSFISFIALSNIQVLREGHCKFYSTIATPLFNIINPHIYAEFVSGAAANDNNWDITFKIWDKRVHGRKLFVKSYREKVGPKGFLAQNHHEIVLVPIIFMLALMLATPLKLKPKLIRTVLAIALYYIFMTLYLSYRFELTMNREVLPLDSFWHILVTFFGLGGNTDPIYIFIFLMWAVMVIPYLLKSGALVKEV